MGCNAPKPKRASGMSAEIEKLRQRANDLHKEVSKEQSQADIDKYDNSLVVNAGMEPLTAHQLKLH